MFMFNYNYSSVSKSIIVCCNLLKNLDDQILKLTPTELNQASFLYLLIVLKN